MPNVISGGVCHCGGDVMFVENYIADKFYTDPVMRDLFALILRVVIIAIILAIYSAICFRKIHIKMGEPGWTAFVPVYNGWILCKHVWGNGALTFINYTARIGRIPPIGPIFAFVTLLGMYTGFGKSTLFKILAIPFSPIAIAICAFDKSTFSNSNVFPKIQTKS